MNEVRLFDYKGFTNKKSYYINRLKNLIGKGVSSNEVMKRRLKIQEYYKNHPSKLHERGKSESSKSLQNKLNYSKSGSLIKRRYNKINREIKKTGSNYKLDSGVNTGMKIAAPLMVAPVPFTSELAIAAASSGKIYDTIQTTRLSKKNSNIKDALKKYRDAKRKIKINDKILDLESKKLNLK